MIDSPSYPPVGSQQQPGDDRSRFSWLTVVAASTAYIALLLLFAAFSDRLINLQGGLIICQSDCTDFHRLSTRIASGEIFASFKGDWHYGPMFRGYVMYVAGLKALFGDVWTQAYIVLNGLLATLSMAVVAKQGASARQHVLFVGAMLLLAVNPGFLMLSKFLLSDYLFALVFGASVVFLSHGLAFGSRRVFLAAAALALTGLFIRPNGLFLVVLTTGFGLAAVLATLIPQWRLRLIAATGPLVGSAALIFMITLAAIAASSAAFLDQLPNALREYGEVVVRHNVVGSGSLQFENRLGANLWTFPWRSYSLNDGSWLGILSSVVERASVLFQILLPPYSRANNLYRLAYYLPLYTLFVLFVAGTLRAPRERPADLILLSFFVGYLLIFLSISPVEIRYRLPIEFLMIVGAARAMAELWERIGPRIASRWQLARSEAAG